MSRACIWFWFWGLGNCKEEGMGLVQAWGPHSPTGTDIAYGDSLCSQPGQQGLSWAQSPGNIISPDTQEWGGLACGWGQSASQLMVAHLQNLLLRGPSCLLHLLLQLLQL